MRSRGDAQCHAWSVQRLRYLYARERAGTSRKSSLCFLRQRGCRQEEKAGERGARRNEAQTRDFHSDR